ncbi:MAG: acyltransferase family protein [Clostridia bacterium]|nr:acyltransferase family protein [Clostridia bacterium]
MQRLENNPTIHLNDSIPEINKKTREKWIDNAKGIAILLVIIGHTTGAYKGTFDFSFVYGVHLCCFFLLSGYTLKKKKITKDYVNAKFARLMSPYFFTCLAVMATDVFNSWCLNHDTSIFTITSIIGRDLLRSFFASGSYKSFGTIEIGTRIGAIWFLPALFFAIMIFQYLLSRTEDKRVLIVTTGVVAYVGFVTGRFIWFPFSVQSGMLATFFLCIGYLIKKNQLLNNLRWYHYIIAQVILVLGIHYGYCNIGIVTANLNDLLLSIPVGLAGCLLIYLVSKIITRARLLPYIGKNSLIVLCVHLYALETMGRYFNLFLDQMQLIGNKRALAFMMLHIIFAIGIAMLISVFKNRIMDRKQPFGQTKTKEGDTTRDQAIDIARGLFICLMIVGHFSIDSLLRKMIFSCHMMAFVIFSGYFYSEHTPLSKTIKKMIRSYLFPYLLFVVAKLLLENRLWSRAYFREAIVRYIYGISYTKKLFGEIGSVGPVYFILMLFVARLVYTILAKIIKEERHLSAAVLCISVFGMILGKEGLWLFWSIDVACYSLVFYHIGVLIRRYDLLRRIREWDAVYFILSPIWAYMIYAGSMEIAVRNYGNYGVVLLGAVAGTLIVYKLSAYISFKMPVIARFLSLSGRFSMPILMVHTLFNGKIVALANQYFYEEWFVTLILALLFQTVLGVALGEICYRIRRFVKPWNEIMNS